jgi:hypothetical protein
VGDTVGEMVREAVGCTHVAYGDSRREHPASSCIARTTHGVRE